MVNTKLLEQIGLSGLDIGYLVIGMGVVIVLLLIVLILLIVQIKKSGKLSKRLDRFMEGKDGNSLEDDIIALFHDNSYLKDRVETNRKDIRTLNRRMEKVFQKVGLVKYDAFHQMGGQLSFCLVLLDEKDNGFLMNSVHSTEGCYSYTKEIKNGECKLDLGKEEQKALAIAMGEEKEKMNK